MRHRRAPAGGPCPRSRRTQAGPRTRLGQRGHAARPPPVQAPKTTADRRGPPGTPATVSVSATFSARLCASGLPAAPWSRGFFRRAFTSGSAVPPWAAWLCLHRRASAPAPPPRPSGVRGSRPVSSGGGGGDGTGPDGTTSRLHTPALTLGPAHSRQLRANGPAAPSCREHHPSPARRGPPRGAPGTERPPPRAC